MDIGQAKKALLNREKVAREGWNGKKMFLYYVGANSYSVEGNPGSAVKGVFENDMVPYQAYVAMKTADNTIVPWLCSQSDFLAEDWVVV